MKLTVVAAIAAFCAVVSTQAQASGTGTKPETGKPPIKPLALPPEQNIGETVGHGDPLLLELRVSGRREETVVSFLIDTGSHDTILDKSFERLLGTRAGKQRLNRVFSGRGIEQANTYAAPKLYLGNVQLLTGPTVLTCDLAASGNNGRCEAVLGMDCLAHYCVQMDFAARKLRFVDPDGLKPEGLGRAFSLDCTNGLPVVSMKLLGDRELRFIVDSGFYQYADGTLPREAIRTARQSRTAKDVGNASFLFENVDIGAESYKKMCLTEMQIEDGRGVAGFLGLSFLARHVVTFNFPGAVLYLRSINARAGM